MSTCGVQGPGRTDLCDLPVPRGRPLRGAAGPPAAGGHPDARVCALDHQGGLQNHARLRTPPPPLSHAHTPNQHHAASINSLNRGNFTPRSNPSPAPTDHSLSGEPPAGGAQEPAHAQDSWLLNSNIPLETRCGAGRAGAAGGGRRGPGHGGPLGARLLFQPGSWVPGHSLETRPSSCQREGRWGGHRAEEAGACVWKSPPRAGLAYFQGVTPAVPCCAAPHSPGSWHTGGSSWKSAGGPLCGRELPQLSA